HNSNKITPQAQTSATAPSCYIAWRTTCCQQQTSRL
ncbi:hypothetical protein SOVF_209780, partial [Spinacia oleracea]